MVATGRFEPPTNALLQHLPNILNTGICKIFHITYTKFYNEIWFMPTYSKELYTRFQY